MYFLWPDHVIGKRESRCIREEHNATVNKLLAERDALLDISKRLLRDMQAVSDYAAQNDHDAFGINHNDAIDDMGEAERIIKTYEATA